MDKFNDYMEEALLEAKKALGKGEIPVGAVIVDKEGNIIGRGHNTRENNLDVSGHAEINAIKEAEKRLGRWTLDGCCIYITLEPCPMCAGAIAQARISAIYFGASDKDNGAIKSKLFLFDELNLPNKPLVYGGIKEEECSALLKSFFERIRR